MDNKTYRKYVHFIIFIVLLYLTYLVFQPFLLLIVTGLIIGYIFYPLYKWVYKKIGCKGISSFIVCIFLILVLGLLIVGIISAVAGEAKSGFTRLAGLIESNGMFSCDPGSDSVVCSIMEQSKAWRDAYQLDSHIQEWLISIGKELTTYATNFILTLPTKVFHFFIVMFITFYAFMDGERLIKNIYKWVPMSQKHFRKMQKAWHDTMQAVVYGQVITAIVQGCVAMIGYALIADIGNPIIWGIVTALFALLPMIGTAIVWVPISIYIIVIGALESSGELIFRGIGLFLYGLLLISTIDNFIKPKIIGDRAKMHPVLILLSIFGGIAIFGLIGLILGPLILSMFVAYVSVHHKGNHLEFSK